MTDSVSIVKCLVCGDEIQTGNRVECQTCDTPHHRDCFEYNGKCAIFACEGKRYRCRWQPKSGIAGSSAPVLAARARTKVRTVLGENEIHIEQTGMLRTFGLGTVATGAAIAAFAPAAGCDMASGLGNGLSFLPDLGELGMIIAVIILVPLTVWLLLRFVIPTLMYIPGYLLFLADNSYWTYDNEKERLVLRGRFFGIPYWRRTWRRERAESVVLAPSVGGSSQYLAVHFTKGRKLWLADDRHHGKVGYDVSDLRRMGTRLAEAMDVPYTETQVQPLLPEEPSE